MRWFGDEPPQTDDEKVNPFVKSKILQVAAEFYQSNLDLEHFKWLREERSLAPETIKKHQLGWANGGLYKHLKDQNFKLDDMLATGLVVLEKDTEAPKGTGSLSWMQPIRRRRASLTTSFGTASQSPITPRVTWC